MAEEVAGRLEVVVESKLDGFAQKLKAKVEAACENIEAKVKATVDTDGLREEFEAKVKAAGEGIKIKVGVDLDLDPAELKAKIEAAAKAAGGKITMNVDTDAMGAAVKQEAEKVATEGSRGSILVALKTKGQLWLEALRQKAVAQSAVDKDPIKVPINIKTPKMPKIGKMIRPAMYAMIGSLIEPAVGAIVQGISGLTAMASAIAPATGTLAAIPLGLSAMVQGMLGVTMASGGMGTALKLLTQQQQALDSGTKMTASQQKQLKAALDKLSPSARTFAKNVMGLKPAWDSTRKVVQEQLFKHLADEVKPLAHTLLPLLQKGLGGTADRIGAVAENAAHWMETPLFGQQFAGMMRSNNKTLTAGGGALLDFAKGFLWFDRAAAPFQKRMDGVIASTGQWFEQMARENAQNGDTAAFLKKAGDRLSQVWAITKDIGGGLAGIFRAAEPSGERLLTLFGDTMDKWNKWVNSDLGQNQIGKFFQHTEGGFKELGRIIRDGGQALLKWGEDPKITRMLRTIRTQLGPAINDMLQALSDDMGQNFIDFITQLARAIDSAEPAIKVVSRLTGALVGLLGVINDLMDAGEHVGGSNGKGGLDITGIIMTGLGIAYAYSKVKKISGIIKALAGGKRAATAAAEGGAAAKAVEKASGKGGWLADLLGGTKAAGKHATGKSDLGSVSKDLEGATGWSGKLEGALGKLSRSPLMKKLGWAGVALGAIDFSNHMKRVSVDAGDVANKVGQSGGDLQKKVAGIKKALQDSQVGEFADKWGLNLQKLAHSIATNGKYAEREMERVRRNFGKDGNLMVGTFNANGSEGAEIASDLKEVVDGFHRAGDAAATAKLQAKLARSEIQNFWAAGGRPGTWGTPKVVAGANPSSLWTDMTKGLKHPQQQQKLSPPQIDLGAFKSQAQQVPQLWDRIMGGFAKKNSLKLPPLDTTPVKHSLTLMDRMLTQSAKGVKQMGLKMPKTNTDPAVKPIRQMKSTINGVLKSLHLKPMKLPRTNTKPALDPLRAAKGQVTTLSKQMGTGAAQGFQKVEKEARNAGQGAKQGMTKGMTGVVTAVRTKGAQAVTSAKKTSTGVKAPFNGLNGPMSAAGAAAMQGLLSGITAWGGRAVAAARNIANQVAAETRRALKVQSPSRVMHEIGAFVSHGFANGIASGRRRVVKAQQGLTKALTDGGRWDRARNDEERRGAESARRLESTARRGEKAADRIDKAKGKAAKAAAAIRKELTKSLVASASDYGSLTSIFDSGGGYLTPAFTISELRRKVSDTRAFRAALKKLKKRGLGDRAYRQLLEAGVEAGSPIAQALLDATPKQLKAINRLQAQLAGAARHIGHDIGNAFKKAGEQAHKGLHNGLNNHKHKKHLHDAGRAMGEEVAKGVRKGLRIHSPSQVMAELGGYAVDGLVLGLNNRAARLMREAQRISHDLSQNLVTQTHTSNLYRASRKANSGAAIREAYGRPGQAAAPLVGQLIIQGKTPEETRDALDQALFALRRIRSGGVHADRTA